MGMKIINGAGLVKPDTDILAQSIYLSGPKEFDYIFGRDAIAFIRYCWTKETLFGARYHTVVTYDGNIAAIMAAYTWREHSILYLKTAARTLRFFPIKQAIICLIRAIKLKRLVGLPSWHNLYLAHVFSHPQYRRMGIVLSKLLPWANHQAQQRNLSGLEGDVRADNECAIRLYTYFGYSIRTIIKATVDQKKDHLCDTYRMYLPLKSLP